VSRSAGFYLRLERLREVGVEAYSWSIPTDTRVCLIQQISPIYLLFLRRTKATLLLYGRTSIWLETNPPPKIILPSPSRLLCSRPRGCSANNRKMHWMKITRWLYGRLSPNVGSKCVVTERKWTCVATHEARTDYNYRGWYYCCCPSVSTISINRDMRSVLNIIYQLSLKNQAIYQDISGWLYDFGKNLSIAED